jgi:hypothetical protein
LPTVGEWLEHDGPIVWCETGLYASRRIIDALSYARGHFISRVECSQLEHEDTDKFVCRRRKVVARIEGEQLLRKFARRQARGAAHLWDMPDVVRKYLETGDEAIRDAARDAAWAAARAAARDVAGAAADAACAAARAAAWAAARDVAGAAWAAARDAALSAAWAAANKMLEDMVMAEMGRQS